MTIAAIFGCAGRRLEEREAAFFREVQPWGFILFGRNIGEPDQVRRLTEALRETVGRDDTPVLIDQEGGRVARLTPPNWPRYPSARAIAELSARHPSLAREMAWLGARLIAHDLHRLGISVNCAPVLDVPAANAHDIIGDRSYGTTPELVGLLGQMAVEGLIAGGVAPVIKHVPGHGRARADSHLELPVVDAGLADLEAVDFAPFRGLADAPMAMTAHIVYRALDPDHPATTSAKVISETVRGRIGFSGLLMTDDLSMRALGGSFADRTRASLRAGCDIVLHCNGDATEMAQVASAAWPLADQSAVRARAALARVARPPESLDLEGPRRHFGAAFDASFAA